MIVNGIGALNLKPGLGDTATDLLQGGVAPAISGNLGTSFAEAVSQAASKTVNTLQNAEQVSLQTTEAGHLGSAATNAGFTIKPQEDDGVVMPSKNTVVLEDQLLKAGEVRRSFELNTAIVKAFHSMMMMAVKS